MKELFEENNEIEAISYKDAMMSIEDIVNRMENNELELDELSKAVKTVSKLIEICKAKLKETEEEVEKILNEIK